MPESRSSSAGPKPPASLRRVTATRADGAKPPTLAPEAGANKAELARVSRRLASRVDEVLLVARHERAVGVGDVPTSGAS